MVDGSLSAAERRYWSRVLKLGFVGIVALSAALIAVQAEAPPVQVALVTVVGAGFGAGLAWYLSWMDVSWNEGRGGRRR